MANRKPVGRRGLQESERKNKKLPPIYVTTDLEEKISAALTAQGKEFSNFGREALESFLKKPTGKSETPAKTLSLPILASVPCGPLEEAFSDNPSRLLVNNDFRSELGVNEDDFFVRAYGQSMEESHITDGALLLIERLPSHKLPRNGQPALVQVIKNGQSSGTIKHWHFKDGKPVLINGKGEEVEIEEGTERIEAVGVVKRAILEF